MLCEWIQCLVYMLLLIFLFYLFLFIFFFLGGRGGGLQQALLILNQFRIYVFQFIISMNVSPHLLKILKPICVFHQGKAPHTAILSNW